MHLKHLANFIHEVDSSIIPYTVMCCTVIQTHDSEVRELIAAVDKQKTGYITYDSFEAVMARSMLHHAGPVDAPDMSATIRLQPDTSALPFHEVLLSYRHTRFILFFHHDCVT